MRKKISVVVVTLNEANTVLDILDKIPEDIVDEILVVDGRSTDGTYEMVNKAGYNIIFQEGKGRGAAFKTGFKKVKGDIVVMLSSDGNERPGDLKKIIARMNQGYDLVIATRFKSGKSHDITLIRNFGNLFLTFMCNLAGGLKLTDAMNGYRAISKDALEKMNIRADDFSIEGEISVKAGKLGLKVGEVPTIEDKREFGDSRLRTFRDGWKIFKAILREAFRNPPYDY